MGLCYRFILFSAFYSYFFLFLTTFIQLKFTQTAPKDHTQNKKLCLLLFSVSFRANKHTHLHDNLSVKWMRCGGFDCFHLFLGYIDVVFDTSSSNSSRRLYYVFCWLSPLNLKFENKNNTVTNILLCKYVNIDECIFFSFYCYFTTFYCLFKNHIQQHHHSRT